MTTFRDNTGRTWSVEINVATVKRVRSLTGVDLLQVADGSLIQRLLSDPVTLVDVLYAICKPAADEAGVSDEDFGRAMAGDSIEAATKALLEGLVSFFPNARDRAALRKVLDATNATMERARDLIETKLDARLKEATDAALAEFGS